MAFEYKCVGAPERPKRQRGISRSERVALAMQEIISAEAVDGWEYLRTDVVPVEEKAGLFSRTHEVQRAILIFRREAGLGRSAATALAASLGDAPEPVPPPVADAGEPRNVRDARVSLSADRGAPPPPRRSRPPSGLG